MTTFLAEDVYKLLEEKDNDLQLAGEIGKALLEKNEQLTRDFDRASQEYLHQIEKLKHENTWLRSQLASNCEELETVMRDHEEDIKSLHEQLSTKAKMFTFQMDKDNETRQLAQQNQRLSAELDKVLAREELLRTSQSEYKSKVVELKRMNSKLSCENDTLRDQECSRRRKLHDLEQRNTRLSVESESLRVKCDELSYNITLLQQEKHDCTEQIRLQEKQIELLKEKSAELLEQLSDMSNRSSDQPSFFEELEYSQKSLTSGYSSNLSLVDELDSDDAMVLMPMDSMTQLKMEIREAFFELQAVIEELEASESPASDAKVKDLSREIGHGELIACAKRIRYLVTHRHQLGSLLAQIAEQKELLSGKDMQIDSLATQIDALSRKESTAAQEVNEDKQVAIDALDKATEEVRLLRADNRRLENELLETIQKKIKLSQQVEQWQLDMEEMVETQVKSMFLLEKQSKPKPIEAPAHSSPEHKKQLPFSRTDKQRFSFFGKKKHT